ncbi:acetyl-CoA acetyltransferase [Terrihabitans soli]|uniref:Acetyl-CoA acetyltransferase n=1 Tax=Terrihabitans soli TaxID=708113 RepID=A0A6S6QY33_9HYPH|nr:thiolase family protein [Terrihabitans soli]BCJ91478.1 acetyl-CoA acetyltransferase [Terrihabitans soli]
MSAFIIAARRTAVAPRDGAFRAVEAHDLAAPVIGAVLDDAGIVPGEVEDVIFGNALYGGGNPARMAALAAGLPDTVPALTIDTQCCAGLDAVLLAAVRVEAGEADVILAGGVESFSRAPLRFVRPRGPEEAPLEYQRPPFAPFADRDPDMIEAAAMLAKELGISRAAQEAFAIESHRKALERNTDEIVAVESLARDAFIRPLDPKLCARLQVIAGDAEHGVTAATIAVEADAAAAVLVVSEKIARRAKHAARILGGARRGGEPERPGLAPIAAVRAALEKAGLKTGALSSAEIMEAFAVQAMACADGLGLDPKILNTGGGALARGHPIGASGAILCVRLFENKKAAREGGFLGLAAIAAAGGLGSALLLGD